MLHFSCQQMMDVSGAFSVKSILFHPEEMTFILSMWNVEIRDIYALLEQGVI